MQMDLSKLQQDEQDDNLLYDNSRNAMYLWSRNEHNEPPSIYITSESYYKEEGCYSDQGTSFLGNIDNKMVFDATFEEIAKEMEALGFVEGCESCWMASSAVCGDEPDVDINVLIDYLKSHPRLKWDMENDENFGLDDED